MATRKGYQLLVRKRKSGIGIRERKRKSGSRWIIDTSYKGHEIGETRATPEMAETNLRKLQTLIDEGRYLEKKKVSKEILGAFADKYLQWCKDSDQKAAESKASHLESIKTHFGKDCLLHTITRKDIEDYQTLLKTSVSEKTGKPLKPASVNRRMACLRHMFSRAVERKELNDNPCRGVRQFRENNRRLRYLTAEECKLLLDSCPKAEPVQLGGRGNLGKPAKAATLKQIVELALNTGMRKSEVLRLEWEHVHLVQGYLEILEQKNGEYSTIPLSPRAIEILRSIPRKFDSPYVFTGRIKGQPFWDLKRQFEEAVKLSGLEGVTFHTLRHTAASHMVMSGAPLATVKEILRHKDYAMTLRYAHLSSEHKKAVIDALGDALTVRPKEEAKTA